jgi:NADPH:quinone reductase-like Zn-dependent oxidoreductase
MTVSSQKAYRLHSYGGPETIQLDDVPIPAAGASQVLVAVRAVGMNPFDWKIREGFVKDSLVLDLPTTLGVDFIGTVAALGDGVSRFVVGERVMGMSQSLGAFAEHIAVDEAILARVPAALTDVDAATLPIPVLTAWQGLHAAGDLHAGMRVLINGASGITGSMAVQFAKHAGAYVIGVASGKNREHTLALGADEFIDYHTDSFHDRVTDIDLIFDCALIGNPDTTKRSWAVLKPGGAIVSVADPSILDQIPDGYHGFSPQADATDVATLEDIANKVVEGTITTKVARVFPRDELIDAMELNKAGGTTGRLVVDFTRA